MSRSYQPVELNTFVGGLITEASPLTFPQNASLDETNFVLNKDGSRSRRLGMDLEDGYSQISLYGDAAIFNSFKWDNAGGVASKSIIVVQAGGRVDFYDCDVTPLSQGQIATFTFATNDRKFSFASVDGKLVVASGDKVIYVFNYDETTYTISMTSNKLLIRDLFGVEDITPGGVNLRIGSDVSTRPDAVIYKTAHIYNLRNQTWALPRAMFNGPNSVGAGDDNAYDPLPIFARVRNPRIWPSNADNILSNLYAQTDAVGSKIVLRLDPGSARINGASNSPAPMGYFIIDALDRGASRVQQYQSMLAKYPQNNATAVDLSQLPTDSSTAGPSCICEYAGRVWYAGFTGDTIGADAHSPKLASYILFSQLVTDMTDIFSCYQEADPTDKDSSDLVDTDGGFLRIQGAFNITGMINLGSTLLVFAENGVWSVSGGNSYGFTATNYKVSKITSAGCISSGSIVNVEGTALYWSRDGIYNITQNQYGDYVANNMTAKTIQKFYNAIPASVVKHAEGVYDSFEKQVKWIYSDRSDITNPAIELVLDTNLGAFYKHEIYPNNNSEDGAVGYPLVIKGIQTNPFAYTYTDDQVVTPFDGDVMVGSDDVVVSTRSEIAGTKEVVYLILLGPFGESSYPSYSFGSYKDTFHYDWTTLFGQTRDAFSYMLTGYLSGGDYQRDKQIVYLTVHCKRTEVLDNDNVLTNNSSCQTQVQWDWTNAPDSGRWSRQFQAYRLFKPYYPVSGSDDGYPTFMNVVETRSKIRGTGKVISILFQSEPGMHLTLYGWSINLGIEGNV